MSALFRVYASPLHTYYESAFIDFLSKKRVSGLECHTISEVLKQRYMSCIIIKILCEGCTPGCSRLRALEKLKQLTVRTNEFEDGDSRFSTSSVSGW